MARQVFPRLGLILAVAALLAACDTSLTADNPYDPDLPIHQQEPALLIGKVVLEAGEPTQAMVEVAPSGKNARPLADGSFEVLGLPPGTYTVQVTAEGHRTWAQAGVFFSAGQRVNMGTIEVLASRGSMQGNVVLKLDEENDADTHGGALVFARPQLEGRLAAGGTGQSAISNPDGSWTLTGLPVGTYQLEGSKDGYAPSQPLEVEVAEDETTQVPDLLLRSITGVISIDEGAQYTNASNRRVMVTVLAFETDEMQISEDRLFADAAWEQHSAQRAWTLSDGDGEKMVYMRFRNASGYETPAMYDTIVLDRAAPVAASVSIADGAEYVTGVQVALSLRAEDALSGVADMRIAVDGDITDETWDRFVSQRLVELDVPDTPDGETGTVLVQYRDGAGNAGDVVEDSVIVDSVVPQNAALEIEYGATRTASRDVMLTLSVEGAREMQVSNDSGLAGAEWQPLSPSVGWRLTENDEQKTVFAKFRDGALNESEIVSDSIELNTRGSASGVFLLENAAANGNADITVSLSTATPTTTTTSQDGSFSFTDVPVGVYSLTASKAGFRTAQVPYLAVLPGENTAVDPVVLTALRGALSGVARRQDAAADGHLGIVVEVVGAGQSSVTNAAGEWTVDNLPLAQFTVRATAEGYHEATRADVSVVADAVTAVPDLVLAPNPGSITGTVTLEGLAEPDLDIAEVVAAGQTVPCGSDGAFEVLDVSAGVHTLLARAPGYASVDLVVLVAPGEATEAGTLALGLARGAIEGMATLAGATDHSGITVEVDGEGYAGVTGIGGAYRIESVPVGAYTLTARKDEYVARRVGAVTVVEERTVTAAPVVLVRAAGDFEILERATDESGYLNDPAVKLVFSEVPQDSAQIWIAEDAGFSTGAWAAFAGSLHNYDLLGGDGPVSVFVKFESSGGAESPVFTSSTVLDRVAPRDTSSVTIDGGAEFTTNPSGDVSLTLFGEDEHSAVARMRIAVDGAIDGETEEVFNSTKTVRLDDPSTDGLKTVLVEFIDLAGNTSAAPASDTVYLDHAGPVNDTIAIDAGAAHAKGALVTLALFAEDICADGYPTGTCDSGLAPPAQMMVSNEMGFPGGEWEAYAVERAWFLKPGDGDKTVHVRFRDAAGNASAEISDDIKLDGTPPGSPQVTVQGGEVTGSADVTLLLSATDGPSEMIVAEGGDFATATWEAYDERPYPFALSAGNGLKTVTAMFRDTAGNVSVVATDTVTLDSQAPGGAVTIIEGPYVSSPGVTLSLSASPDATHVCVYGDVEGACDPAGNPSTWDVFAATLAVDLSAVDGVKTARVRLADSAGNKSGEMTASTTLDATDPTGLTLTVNGEGPDGYSRSVAITLQIAAADATSGLADMMVSESSTFSDASWESFATVRGWTLSGVDGTKTLYVRVRDRAGNFDDVSDTVILDRAPPQFTAGPTVSGDAPDDRVGYTRDEVVRAGFTVQDELEAETDLTYCIAGNPALDGATCGNPPANGVVAQAWTLTLEEESKTVYFSVADPAGNEITGSSLIVLDGTPPLSPTMVIDDADRPYTLDDQITLHLGAVDASRVHLSENAAAPGRDDAGWAAFDPGAPTAVFDLSDSEGNKTVYAFYQDAAGNVTAAAVSDSTFHDTATPSGTAFTITGTSHYDRIGEAPVDEPRDDTIATMTTTVSLTLTADDGGTGSGVSEMLLSNDPLFSGAVWQPYQTEVDLWALLGGAADYVDRTVYARFRDAAGRESNTLNATIKLDNTAPTGPSVSLEAGDEYLIGTAADVTLTATAADFRQLSLDSAFVGEMWSGFTSPEAVNNFDLGGEGTRTVYARFRDEVGNLAALASDSIIADDAAPTQASVLINGDAEFSRNAAGAVTLVLYAEDQISGVDEMRFSNDDAAWSGWLPYATVYGPWTLETPTSQNDVVKTVYAQFRDNAGQQTTPVSDTIRLDNVRPTIDAPGLQINGTDLYTTQAVVTLTLPATDAFDLKISDGSGCIGGTWGTYAGPTGYWVLEEGDEQVRTVSAVVRDEAGNLSSTCSEDSITIDTISPIVQSLTLDGCADSDGGDCEESGGGGDGGHDPYYTADEYVAVWVDVGGTCDDIEFSNTEDFSGFVNTHACSTVFPIIEPYAVGGSGPKTLYVRAVDAAGNVSNVTQDTVFKDRKIPKFRSVIIEGGSPVTDDTTVDLTLQAQSDGAPMFRMFVDEDADPLDQPGVDYAPTYPGFTFSTTGLVTATVAYEDTAGNITDAATHAHDSIFIDTLAPNVPSITKICVAGTNPLTCPAITRTNNTEVTLVFDASDRDEQPADGGSGIAEMKVAEGLTVGSLVGVNWQDFKPYLSFQLPIENGTKRIWLGVRDHVEHETPAASAVQVELDTEKPVVDGRILINDDEPYTNSVDVTMTSAVWDNLDSQGELEIAFNCTGRIDTVDGQPCVNGTWYPYNPAAALRLLAPDGLKRIWVAFRDRAGNTTGNFEDEIYLDTDPPSGTAIYFISPGNHEVDLAWNASTSGDVTHYKLYWGLRTGGADPADYPSSIDEIEGTSHTHIGVENIIYPYFYRVAAVDRAGNESALSDEVDTVAGWQTRRWIDPDQYGGGGNEVAVGDDDTIWSAYSQDGDSLWVTYCAFDCYDDANWTRLQLSADADLGNLMTVKHVPFVAYEESDNAHLSWCEADDCSLLANWTTVSMSETGISDVRAQMGGASNVVLLYRRSGGLQARNCYWYQDCSVEGSWAAEYEVDATCDDDGQVIDITHSNEMFWVVYGSSNDIKIASCLSWLGCTKDGQWNAFVIDSTSSTGTWRHFSISADDSNSHADGRVLVAFPPANYDVRISGCGFANDCQNPANWSTYYDLPDSRMYPVIRTTYDGLFVAAQDRANYNTALDFCYFGYDRVLGGAYCQDAANWYSTTVDDLGQTGYDVAMAIGGGMREPVISYRTVGVNMNRMALPYELAPAGFYAMPAPDGYYFHWTPKTPESADGYRVVFDFSAAVPGGLVPPGWTGGFHDLFWLGGFSTYEYLSERDYGFFDQYLLSLKSYKDVYDTGASTSVHEVRPFTQINFDDSGSSSTNATAGIGARRSGNSKQVFIPSLNRRTDSNLYLTMHSCIGQDCRNAANWQSFDLESMGNIPSVYPGGNPTVTMRADRIWISWFDRASSEVKAAYCEDTMPNCQNQANWTLATVATGVEPGYSYSAHLSSDDMYNGDHMLLSYIDQHAANHGVYLALCDPTAGSCATADDWTKTKFDSSAAGTPQYRHTSLDSYGAGHVFISYQMDDELKLAHCFAAGCTVPGLYDLATLDTNPDYSTFEPNGWAASSLSIANNSYRLMYDNNRATRLANCLGTQAQCSLAANWSSFEIPGTRPLNAPLSGDRRMTVPLSGLFGLTSDTNGFLSIAYCARLCTDPESWRIGQLDDNSSNYFMFPQVAADVLGSLHIVRSGDEDTTSYPNILFDGFVRMSD